MARYRYRTEQGREFLREYPMGQAPATVLFEGVVAERVFTLPQLTTNPARFRTENKMECILGGSREWTQRQRDSEKDRYENRLETPQIVGMD